KTRSAGTRPVAHIRLTAWPLIPISLASADCPPALSAALEIAFMVEPLYQLSVDLKGQLTIDQAPCKYQPMVDTQKIRDEFAARLNKALDDVPSVRPARGRNTDLHELLRANGLSSSKQATHK